MQATDVKLTATQNDEGVLEIFAEGIGLVGEIRVNELQEFSAADFGGTASTIRLEMVGNGIRVNDHAFGKLSDPTKPKIMTSIGSTLSRAI